MGTDSSEEMVEVIRPDGSVLGIVSRSEMRSRNLLHRSVYVAVWAGSVLSPEVVVHQRSNTKDVNPSFWDLSFGGVCDVGEDWLDAAKRELAEEAGIVDKELIPLGQGSYEDAHVAVVGEVFVLRYDGPISFVDGEVQRSERVPIQELDDWLNGRSVCADTAALVRPKLDEFVKTIQSREI